MRSRSCSDSETKILRFVFVLTALAPLGVVFWGRREGEFLYVLYREPKLIALQIGGWLFLCVFALICGAGVRRREIESVLRSPVMMLLFVFLAWSGLTRLWASVPENWRYEWKQWLLGFFLIFVLQLWVRRDAGLTRFLVRISAIGMGVVVLLGFLQALSAEARALTITEVRLGRIQSSFFGNKNPFAEALVGQIFLVAWLAATARSTRTRIAWSALLLVEIAATAELRSLPGYAAAATGLVVLWIALLAGRSGAGRRRAAILGVLVLALFAAALVFRPFNRAAAVSLVRAAADPSIYLESPRGVFLRNTLHMARENPLGVGLGDWQTQYPVYRLHDRRESFTVQRQVRRAHSDPVQLLGETGFPGLLLWLGLCGALFWCCFQGIRRGETIFFFLAAQHAAFFAAMLVDFTLEYPWLKHQWLLLIALTLMNSPIEEVPASSPVDRRVRFAAVGVLSLILIASIVEHASLMRKLEFSGRLRIDYLQAIGHHRGVVRQDAPPDAYALHRLLEEGPKLDDFGHTKDLYRDLLLLGHAAQLSDRRELGRAYADRALELHPYNPNALRLRAVLSDDPDERVVLQRAYDHVMDEATSGFAP